MTTKHIYLIDGSGYIFRAYYAIRSLSNSKGMPTNAIYGFTQMLLKFLRGENPQYLAMVLDTEEPTFRDEMYDQYKANRSAPPDDLVPQFPYIPKVVQALNVPLLAMPGYEADDVIATVAKKAVEEGFEVTVISGDKDLMQLVGEGIGMYDPMKEKHYAVKEVIERFGVPPSRVSDVMGLTGDSSDNIPGVAGIGPKTAAKLIQEYGSLENLLANAEKIPGKTGESLKANAANARLSKKLATLKCDVPLAFEEKNFHYQTFDPDACHKLFTELEFSKLVAELAPRKTLSKKGYRLIQDEKELRELCQMLEKKKPMLSIDLETTSLHVMQASPVGFSLAWAKGEAAYIPVGHEGFESLQQIPLAKVIEYLKPILADPEIPKVGQNFKYDLAILSRYGLKINTSPQSGREGEAPLALPVEGALPAPVIDTMIASYLLNPAGPHNLDALSQQHLDHKTIRYEDVTGKGAKQIPFAKVPLEVAKDYSCEDADCAWQLAQIFLPELKKQNLFALFKDLEMPLMEVLLKMEMTGVKVDTQILNKMSQEFGKGLFELEKKIFESSEGPFNINSPKQLGEVLFERLKIKGGKKTKTGYSTSQDVLESLSLKHPLPELVLQYRSLSKLKSTYTDALQKLVEPATGRIHTSFNQTVAATGRLSSSDPNLQNIPIRSEEGRKIRAAFVAEEGSVLLSADYSQIELRILAHFTKDEGLIKAFEKGEDVHRLTAMALFGVKESEVTSAQRSVGKTVNFAVIYGQTPYGLSSQLKIGVEEAILYIDNFFKQYPKVLQFKEEIISQAQEKGFVTTLFGRRRFFPDILSQNGNRRQIAERMAFNTVFQGSAADIIKQAMIDIDKDLPKISGASKMILQVHDELVFEVPKGEVAAVLSFVKEKMEQAHPLKVPVTVDCHFGRNWNE